MEEHAERDHVASILKLTLLALPVPDHTGSLTVAPGTPEHLQAAPLDRNTCACSAHQAHLAIRKALARIESHQCWSCTNFDPAGGPVGSKVHFVDRRP